jgi:hypothetical protein
LHISSHRCPQSITALHRKARKSRAFERGRSWGDRPRTCARRRADRRPARFLAASTLVLAHLLAGPFRTAPAEAALDFLVSRRAAARPNPEQVEAAQLAAFALREDE